MSYTREREEFLIRIIAEGLGYDAAKRLLREATTIHRLAELACSSEAADRDRIPCPKAAWDTRTHEGRKGIAHGPCLCDFDGEHHDIPRIRWQDYLAEQRARAVLPSGWRVVTAGDPRGYTLRVIPPSFAARNKGRDVHNLDAIGVPARASGIRW